MPAIPSTTPTILLVDDDPGIRLFCGCLLRAAGYPVVEADGGVEALAQLGRTKPALILLDVEMPGGNGWETLQTLRQRGHWQPVLMLTGAVSVADRVRGLSAGADDYLCKPCDGRELLARVHAALRRSQPAPAPEVLRFGATVVDLTNRTAQRAGVAVALTRTEFALLELLARQAGRPLGREAILEGVWGYVSGTSTRTVETHIWRLRGKLQDDAAEPRWIRTVPGFGYQLMNEAVPAAA